MAGIVVGVDGSENANRALEWAVAEAGLRKVPVTALTVVPIPITLEPSSVAAMGLSRCFVPPRRPLAPP